MGGILKESYPTVGNFSQVGSKLLAATQRPAHFHSAAGGGAIMGRRYYWGSDETWLARKSLVKRSFNHGFYHQISGFPVKFPIIQFYDLEEKSSK